MPSTDAPTNPSTTYDWAAVVGGTAGIIGLLGMTACVVFSAAGRSAHGYAPIPSGLTAVASVMTVAGIVMVLWRVIVAKEQSLMDRLDRIDDKLDNVWGIAATTSIESKPASVKPHAPRQRKRRRQGADASGENVIPLRARGAADALRRLTEQIKDEPNA